MIFFKKHVDQDFCYWYDNYIVPTKLKNKKFKMLDKFNLFKSKVRLLLKKMGII